MTNPEPPTGPVTFDISARSILMTAPGGTPIEIGVQVRRIDLVGTSSGWEVGLTFVPNTVVNLHGIPAERVIITHDAERFLDRITPADLDKAIADGGFSSTPGARVVRYLRDLIAGGG